MELLLAILVAGPLGYFVTRRRALFCLLAAWAAVFPVQTAVVRSEGDLDWSYRPLSVVILGGGLTLNHFGSVLATRRRGSARAVTTTPAGRP